MRFDLVDLRLFLHIAETGSITRGAERAHLALASASERLRGMEDIIGVKLVERKRRGAVLTAAGACLADHARVVVQDVDRMRGDLAAYARGMKGFVRVLTNTAALSEHLPAALASFLAAHQEIAIDLEERESGRIVEAIAAGDADIGIAFDAVMSPAVVSHPFRSDRLVLVVPGGDPVSARRRVFFKDIVARDFVGLSRESALQRHLSGQAARLGMRMRLRVRVGSLDAVCRMVGAGVGVGIVPHATARRCRAAMRIGVVALADPWCERNLVICVRPGTLPAPVKRLVAHLQEPATGHVR
ncbi:MAG: LysR family transcriptional regulator [Xanthobacteraceae bacterium]